MLEMSKDVAIRVVRTTGSVIAMVLIWRLVEGALNAGINGALFFIGVAAIAGLGGYELRWVVDAIKARKSGGDNQGSGS